MRNSVLFSRQRAAKGAEPWRRQYSTQFKACEKSSTCQACTAIWVFAYLEKFVWMPPNRRVRSHEIIYGNQCGIHIGARWHQWIFEIEMNEWRQGYYLSKVNLATHSLSSKKSDADGVGADPSCGELKIHAYYYCFKAIAVYLLTIWLRGGPALSLMGPMVWKVLVWVWAEAFSRESGQLADLPVLCYWQACSLSGVVVVHFVAV